jgi:hypothetical protein
MSVLLRFTESDYPFGIFKLFCYPCIHQNSMCWQCKGSLRDRHAIHGVSFYTGSRVPVDYIRLVDLWCKGLFFKEIIFLLRRVWWYQRGNQNPFIEQEQTTQWPKEKVQKDYQRSTKHTHKTKDRIIPTPLKTGGELRCSGRVRSSCSTSGTRRVNLVTNPVISHEWGKDREVFTTSRT